MNNHKNILNVIISSSSQFILLALGLIVPRLMLVNYGSDTNGLTATVTQIFTYLALLEAGIGQAAKVSLYRPVKEQNVDEINRVLCSASRYYRSVTMLYLVAVLGLAFVMPVTLHTSVAYWTVFFFILFEGLTKVVSFYFINTWKCLLMVEGEAYIINIITLFTNVCGYAVRISLVLLQYNIALIQVGYFFVSLVQMSFYRLYIKKRFPWAKLRQGKDEFKLPDRNAFLVTEIAWTVFSSTDMIILSSVISTAMSSVYSVYNMVFVSLASLLNNVYVSVNQNLGIAYHTGLEKYKEVHDCYHSLFLGAMTSMMCVSYLLILPFVKLYTHGVNDIQYIYTLLPILFCLVQMLSWSRYVSGNLTGLAGYAKQASYVSIVEAATNLTLSLLLVRKFELVGVLFATVVALPIKALYCSWVADYKVMKRPPWRTVSITGCNFAVFFATVALKPLFAKMEIQNYFQLILWGGILTALYVGIVLICNMAVNRDFAKMLMTHIRKPMKGQL